MADGLYAEGVKIFGQGGIVWKASGGSTIKAALVKNTYTANLATHRNYSDVSTYVQGTPGALTLIDAADNGVCDANDITFTSVTNGGSDVDNAIVIYKDTGVAGTSTLIAYIDTATGLPVTPNGGNITVTWDNGTYKIFQL